MNKRINKIRNYNQILLAIAGSIGVLMLFISGIFLIAELADDLFRDNDDYRGILAIDETDRLLRDTLRKQIVTFDKIEIIDSLEQTYILPVTQANLADAESANDMIGLMNTFGKGSNYRYHTYVYNNLIVYNSTSDISEILFEERVCIQNYLIHEKTDNKYIIIPASNSDSNGDKLLNDEDLQVLFVYDLDNRKLSRIKSEENYTTLRVYQPKQSQSLIGHFGIDRNKNGEFDRSTEPMLFFKIDLETMTLVKVVNNEQINQLQKLLEGR